MEMRDGGGDKRGKMEKWKAGEGKRRDRANRDDTEMRRRQRHRKTENPSSSYAV